jgi:drug/metabolite transporter (DMT)-like permease
LKTPGTPKEALLLAVIGVLFFVGFMILREAQIRAPNMALVNAIAYSSVALTLPIMHMVFGDSMTGRAFLGVLLVIGGILLAVS